MALMDCPECGHQVSTHAKSCPSCGYDIEDEPYPKRLGHSDQDEDSPLPHSRLGVASFIIGLFLFLTSAGEFLLLTSYVSPADPLLPLLGHAIIGSIPIALMGLMLGFIGLVAGRRSKVFPLLGLIMNVVVFLGWSGLSCIGFDPTNMH